MESRRGARYRTGLDGGCNLGCRPQPQSLEPKRIKTPDAGEAGCCGSQLRTFWTVEATSNDSSSPPCVCAPLCVCLGGKTWEYELPRMRCRSAGLYSCCWKCQALSTPSIL